MSAVAQAAFGKTVFQAPNARFVVNTIGRLVFAFVVVSSVATRLPRRTQQAGRSD